MHRERRTFSEWRGAALVRSDRGYEVAGAETSTLLL